MSIMGMRQAILPMLRNSLFGLIVALASLAPFSGAPEASPVASATAVVCRDDLASFALPDGRALTFEVEIADTVAARAQGLMYRRSLPAGEGMLFIYESPEPVSFWMRNTLIPLDLVFMDERGVIRHIHRNARPLDETPIPGASPLDPAPERLMVLEIAGGEAARLGLARGQAMAHPRLDPAFAAWPCQ